MADTPETFLLRWLVAFSPILILVVVITGFRWKASRAGALSYLVAILAGWVVFGGAPDLLAVASAKGLSLSLFVLLIVWSAVFLYNVVTEVGGVNVIARAMTGVTHDPALRTLLMAWCFAGFMQGIAGFGVPVAVVAPLMLGMSIGPLVAVPAVMIGHSWAISFGSMASSYYTIQLVTKIPGEQIGPWMAFLFALPIVATGFAVAHIQGGWPAVRHAAPAVVAAGAAMAAGTIVLNLVNAPQIASIISGLLGCVVLALVARSKRYKLSYWPAEQEQAGKAPATDEPAGNVSFHMAFLPYYVLIGLTAISQLPPVLAATKTWAWGLDYPAMTTALGYHVNAETMYAKIRLINHPAPLVMAATLITFLVYRLTGNWRKGAGWKAAQLTFKRSISTSLAISTMVMMALVVIDSGMASFLAQGIQKVAGPAFPVLSPYIGVLGSFITGSNTNSNIMFGALQVQTAKALGVSVVVIAAIQSIGGSIGAGISPDKTLIGAAVTHMTGKEHLFMRKAVPYGLIIAGLVGLQAWVIIYLLRLAVP